jgi:serine/threonine-protein kinase HipA
VRSLYVLKRDRVVGELRAEDTRPVQYTFVYESAAAENDFVSLTMPPAARTVWGPRPTLHPIFDMNLPEGERRLYLERAARVGGADDFTLLEAIGGRQIGLLRFVHDPKDPRPVITPIREERLKHIENGLTFFESVFKDLVASSGVSGVQPKLLAATSLDDALEEGLPGTLIGETHILKRDRDRYAGMIVSEFLCAEALKQAQLPVAQCSLSDDGALLIIERFDRTASAALHFEEFCSLMGLTSAEKYDATYEKLIASVNAFVAPESRQSAVTSVFRALVCYRLIGNADAHMKNFGVLCTSYHDIRLAPFYDAVCTRAFENTPPGVQMGGKAAWWNHATLSAFGRYCGLSAKPTEAHIEEVCAAVEKTLPKIEAAREQYSHFDEVGSRMATVWKDALEEIRGKHRKSPTRLKYLRRKRKRLRTMGGVS